MMTNPAAFPAQDLAMQLRGALTAKGAQLLVHQASCKAQVGLIRGQNSSKAGKVTGRINGRLVDAATHLSSSATAPF